MNIDEFEKIQQGLARITGIPLIFIKQKYPNPETSLKEIKKMIDDEISGLKALQKPEIQAIIDTSLDQQDAENKISNYFKKDFILNWQVKIRVSEIDYALNAYSEKNKLDFETFLHSDQYHNIIIQLIYPIYFKIFHYISINFFDSSGENQINEDYKQFILQNQNAIIQILQKYLQKYTPKDNSYYILNKEQYSQELAQIITNFFKNKKNNQQT